jgi:hypothetical protein
MLRTKWTVWTAKLLASPLLIRTLKIRSETGFLRVLLAQKDLEVCLVVTATLVWTALQAQKALKVLRACLVSPASKASLAKMAQLALEAFKDRVAAAAPKAAMAKTAPKEWLAVPDLLVFLDQKALRVTLAPWALEEQMAQKVLQESKAQLDPVVCQALPELLASPAKKVNLVLLASVVVPVAPDETDWRAPPETRVPPALQAPMVLPASAALRAGKAPRAMPAPWATLANPVATEPLALLELLVCRDLPDPQVTSLPHIFACLRTC